MAWVPAAGYQMWTCPGCGAYANAAALETCPHCGTAKPGTIAVPAGPAGAALEQPATVTARPRQQRRRKTAA